MPPSHKVAPGLQISIDQFATALNWSVQTTSEHALLASKSLGGHTLTWAFEFYDESTANELTSLEIAASIAVVVERNHIVDVIATEALASTRRWREEIRSAIVKRVVDGKRVQIGTAKAFFGRFAADVASAHAQQLPKLLARHSIQKPVRPSFSDAEDGLQAMLEQFTASDGSRLNVVTGSAGAGKSVFAIMLAAELVRRCKRDPAKNPAPFLVWFSNARPGQLEELVTLTLHDLGLASALTADAARLLVQHGHLLLVLDGFDEVSRTSADVAAHNVHELSRDINQRTLGRLVLTSRPAFLEQEEAFADLKAGCEADTARLRELAPYTDDQIGQWVLQNPPVDLHGRTPEQHWQRIQQALGSNADLKQVCRIPVFLWMLSEVLAEERSVASSYGLIGEFCQATWERERAKRTVMPTDEEYGYAYEAIALMVIREGDIDARDVRSALELYLGDYAPDLLAALGQDAQSVVSDLAIGPFTTRNGRYGFIHEVFQSYFLSRLLARSAREGRRIADYWAMRMDSNLLRFVREALKEITIDELNRTKLQQFAEQTRNGLLTWNLCQALDLKRAVRLFENKNVAGVVFEQEDLSGLSFAHADLIDATFDRCNLEGCDFSGAQIRKVKLVSCGQGARFDSPVRTHEAAELHIISATKGVELYVGSEITEALVRLGSTEKSSPRPNIDAESGLLIVFKSLFKADRKKLDYPEPVKIDHRVRAWLSSQGRSGDELVRLTRLFANAVGELQKLGFIERNQNRPRTLCPTEAGKRAMLSSFRIGRLDRSDQRLATCASELQAALDASQVTEGKRA